MPRFDQNDIERIRNAVDIVDLIGEHVPLKRAGKVYKALCPFHREKTPSFTVNPELQIYKCFGCGRGGDVFSYLMATENVTFPEAVALLAERAGIPLPEDSGGTSSSSGPDRASIYKVNEWAVSQYESWLRGSDGTAAREYLKSRRIGETAVQRFRLGYAPQRWQNLVDAARRSRMRRQDVAAAGLIRKGASGWFDLFRDRLIFPIHDLRGRVAGFGGRILKGDDGPKYLNTPETPVFSKSKLLYGLHQARDSIRSERVAILVEGYTDVIACHQAGITNVCAVLGVALTKEHLHVLRRFADRIVLVFDADFAGQQSSARSIDLLLEEQIEGRVMTLPEGLDPFDFVQERGADAFREAIGKAVPVLEFKVAFLQHQFDFSVAEQKVKAIDAALETVSRVRNPVFRDELLARLAELTDTREEALRTQLARVARKRRASPDETSEEPTAQADWSPVELELLQVMAFHSEEVPYVLEHVDLQKVIRSSAARAAAEEIVKQYQKNASVDVAAVMSALQSSGLDRIGEQILNYNETGMPVREHTDHCLQALNRRSKTDQLAELRKAILDAEKSGDPARKQMLMKEYLEALRAVKT